MPWPNATRILRDRYSSVHLLLGVIRRRALTLQARPDRLRKEPHTQSLDLIATVAPEFNAISVARIPATSERLSGEEFLS
jgi:hypothetical protein